MVPGKAMHRPSTTSQDLQCRVCGLAPGHQELMNPKLSTRNKYQPDRTKRAQVSLCPQCPNCKTRSAAPSGLAPGPKQITAPSDSETSYGKPAQLPGIPSLPLCPVPRSRPVLVRTRLPTDPAPLYGNAAYPTNDVPLLSAVWSSQMYCCTQRTNRTGMQ